MRLFSCSQCNNTVYFENVRCMNCSATLAYLPAIHDISVIQPEASNNGTTTTYRAMSPAAGNTLYRLCANSIHGVCNWAIPSSDANEFCPSCRLNDIVPNLSTAGTLAAWQKLELAKRRLYYTLDQLGLPIESRVENPSNGLQFRFMQDTDQQKVFTGHSDGIITVNIAEADDPLREKFKKNLGESYRTLIGHFRHEIGHYYWDRLVKNSDWLHGFRELFGDETVDYQEAIDRHYAQGMPPEWYLTYITAYASMHPWEDWAETWAHYFHAIDTIETARDHGVVFRTVPTGTTSEEVATVTVDRTSFDDLMDAWIPLTMVLNNLNRSMGIPDPYPFVLTPTILAKLRFVHDLILSCCDKERIH